MGTNAVNPAAAGRPGTGLESLGPTDLDAVVRVGAALRGAAPLGVAFSGGVDSSVLLALAARELGHRQVIAILAVSPSLPAAERSAAWTVAATIGVRLVEIATFEGDRPQYRRNGPDRCFHCKDELFTRIDDELVAAHRLAAIAYGENADDARRPDRPGARAATEHAVLRPLAEAGLDKATVRRIAAALRLPCADKPAAPCLASRIPHFHPVLPAALAQIERAEAALHGLGLDELRVRHHDEVARVELALPDLIRAQCEPLRSAVIAAVRSAGFTQVTIDPDGLQSGAFTLRALDGQSA